MTATVAGNRWRTRARRFTDDGGTLRTVTVTATGAVTVATVTLVKAPDHRGQWCLWPTAAATEVLGTVPAGRADGYRLAEQLLTRAGYALAEPWTTAGRDPVAVVTRRP